MVQVEDSSGGGGGEIIFYLSLTALPAPPTLLPTITTPLGSTALSYATLENPTARPAVIKGSLHCFPEEEDGTPAGVWVMPMKECLVMDNYNFGDETVETPAASVAAAVRGVPWRGNILPPFSSLRVPIRYSPSSLLRAQTAELTFESPTLGRWVFHCTGRGTAPDSQLSSPHFISAPVALNSEGELCGTISQLPFKNPFNAPLKLTLTLSMTLDASAAAGPHPQYKGNPEQSVLTFLLPNGTHSCTQELTIPSLATLPFPIVFTPKHMGLVRGVATMTCRSPPAAGDAAAAASTLTWRVPILATGEAPTLPTVSHLRGVAGVSSTLTLTLDLPGVLPGSGAGGGGGAGDAAAAASPRDFALSLQDPPSSKGKLTSMVNFAFQGGPAQRDIWDYIGNKGMLENPADLAYFGKSNNSNLTGGSINGMMWEPLLGGGPSAFEPPLSTGIFPSNQTANLASAAGSGARAVIGGGGGSYNSRGNTAGASVHTKGGSSVLTSVGDEKGEVEEEAGNIEAAIHSRALALRYLSSYLTFAPVGVDPTFSGASGGKLTLQCTLSPQRPLDSRVDLEINFKGKGVWRAPLRVTVAPVEAVGEPVIIESPALETTTIHTIQLANCVPRSSIFSAALSLDSHTEFKVLTPSGTLPSSSLGMLVRGTGQGGPSVMTTAPIQISFTPREYGVSYKARLVVDTAENQWAFNLLGRVKDPSVPRGQTGIDDHLGAHSKALLAAATKKTLMGGRGGRN